MKELEKGMELESKKLEEEEAGEVNAGTTVPASEAEYAAVNITFKKGAELGKVTTKEDGAIAEVRNNTRGEIELWGKSGSSVLDSGEHGHVSEAF